MPSPITLTEATLNTIDRLTAVLIALVGAIFPIALTGSTPTFPDQAAKTLFFRLTHLVTTLIRFSNFGIRAPVKPAATLHARTNPANANRPSHSPAQRLPSRPGWLLAALPEFAPAIAADLAALLADPALATLFAAAPTLLRDLRPLLRSLGLTQQPPTPNPPSPQPPSSNPTARRLTPSPNPRANHPIPRPSPAPPPRIDPIVPRPFHAHFVTKSQ